ncbi:hypothetical protein Ae201684P_015362 [Aphanomyces euteiches]|uniref:Uncharacterized protein n=1 Tax=Aphanomyces euteiches TaxID=100861 RepID=A0A6G0WQV7_9STRA|nr:hypothetical protein Ae201684_012665 [Aphanomyces euteiches]KAH9095558.1 hypothetical protein Ae201684P_015362 [Aphanomyces euteiches]KAH9146629.1 hypothetical protein AeRB84_009518 [Aphanomyces euteiches]
MNILDLGFFAAIQSLQHRQSSRSIDELIDNVLKAFEDYPYQLLNHTFLTLQSCLVETMKNSGGNTFKIPHMAKQKNERHGQLPQNVLCPPDVYAEALASLNLHDGDEMDRKCDKESEEQREIDELAQYLETIALNIRAKRTFLWP